MKLKESDLQNIQLNISKYSLINIKAFFIISYLYISVVNLISTTANNEAIMDEQGESRFNITSLPKHHQLMVSHIDDPVLWNCRDTSLTKNYYKILYLMLFITSAVATVLFFGLKTLNFCGDSPLRRLWEIAVTQHLKETHNSRNRYSLQEANEIIDWYRDIFQLFKSNISEIKNSVTSSYMYLRSFAPILSTLYLTVGWWLLLLFYDLHPLSCLLGPNEDTVHYNNKDSAVEIKYSPVLLGFQIPAVLIGGALLGAFVLNSVFFYAINCLIIDEMKVKVQCKYDEAAGHYGSDLVTTVID